MQSQAQAQQIERRKHPRYTCEMGVEIRTGSAESGYWGTLADISLGGCYVNSFSPLPVGTAVVLVNNAEPAKINVAGTTITSHPGLGMGVMFIGTAGADDEAQLRSLIARLSYGS